MIFFCCFWFLLLNVLQFCWIHMATLNYRVLCMKIFFGHAVDVTQFLIFLLWKISVTTDNPGTEEPSMLGLSICCAVINVKWINRRACSVLGHLCVCLSVCICIYCTICSTKLASFSGQCRPHILSWIGQSYSLPAAV